MCFSAEASFAVSGVNAVIGLAILAKKPKRNEALLACFPFLFAVQQFSEGVLWLMLPGAAAGVAAYTWPATLFIIVAETIWPVLTPIAVLALEGDQRREKLLQALAGLGLLVSGYLLYAILASPIDAEISGQNIRYFNDFPYLLRYRLLYVMCICGPLLLSSHPALRVYGVLVFLGYVVSLYLYTGSLISVWCFVAAAADGVLYFHFQRMRPA